MCGDGFKYTVTVVQTTVSGGNDILRFTVNEDHEPVVLKDLSQF